MPPRDEESRFEQVLARHLRRGGTGAGCPDSETLAAYHERALTAEEMNAFKGHIAACGSCQEVLAGLEASEGVIAREEHDLRVGSFGSAETMHAVAMDAAPAPRVVTAQAPRERPKRIWKWMAPAAAVAAGLLVWVGVRQMRNVPRGTTTVAVNTQPSAPSDARRPSPALREQAPAQSAGAQASLADKRAQPALPAAPPPATLSGTRKEADELTAQLSSGKDQKLYQKLPRQDESAKTERYGYSAQAENEVSALTKQQAIGGENAARGKQKAPTAAPSAQVAMESGKKEAGQQVAMENAPNKSPESSEYRVGQLTEREKARPAAEERQKQAQADNDTVAITAAGAAETKRVVTANEGERKFAKAAGAPQPATVARNMQAFNVKSAVGLAVAPEKRAMWAVGAGGMILKSLDGGTTWIPQASGVAAELLAGSAPSATVCWVVGRGGTILRTTDGEHWERVASPVKSDLIGIDARDAQTAAVWTSEKLPKYVTRNGGKTWQRTEH